MTDVLIRRGKNTQTQGIRPCEEVKTGTEIGTVQL